MCVTFLLKLASVPKLRNLPFKHINTSCFSLTHAVICALSHEWNGSWCFSIEKILERAKCTFLFFSSSKFIVVNNSTKIFVRQNKFFTRYACVYKLYIALYFCYLVRLAHFLAVFYRFIAVLTRLWIISFFIENYSFFFASTIPDRKFIQM